MRPCGFHGNIPRSPFIKRAGFPLFLLSLWAPFAVNWELEKDWSQVQEVSKDTDCLSLHTFSSKESRHYRELFALALVCVLIMFPYYPRHVAVLTETIKKGIHDADSEARSIARK